MGLFIISSILMGIVILLHILYAKVFVNKVDLNGEMFFEIGIAIGYLFFGAFFGIMVISTISSILGNDATRARLQLKYDNLNARVAKWEQGDISDASLWSDVQEYNEDIRSGQYWRRSFWTNILNEECYLEFEQIEIPEYTEK